MGEKNLPTTVKDSSGGNLRHWPDFASAKDFLRENLLIFIFGFLGLIFLLAGVVSLSLGSASKEPEVVIEEGVGVAAGKIKVDVSGAVVHPGVCELDGNLRVQEALVLAGGLSSSADREWVAKNLNLAAKLSDGAKIYIPKTGEVKTSESLSSVVSEGAGGNLAGKVNINSATLEELDKLPEVGPVTAQKIIAGRPYQTIEDLLNKKIVGASVFSKIKNQISLW